MRRLLKEDPETFTEAIIQDLLKKPGTAATVRIWARIADREKAETAFAGQLAEDYREDHAGWDNQLIGHFMQLGFDRTNWRKVAAYLLNKYAPLPDLPAARVLVGPSAN